MPAPHHNGICRKRGEINAFWGKAKFFLPSFKEAGIPKIVTLQAHSHSADADNPTKSDPSQKKPGKKRERRKEEKNEKDPPGGLQQRAKPVPNNNAPGTAFIHC